MLKSFHLPCPVLHLYKLQVAASQFHMGKWHREQDSESGQQKYEGREKSSTDITFFAEKISLRPFYFLHAASTTTQKWSDFQLKAHKFWKTAISSKAPLKHLHFPPGKYFSAFPIFVHEVQHQWKILCITKQQQRSFAVHSIFHYCLNNLSSFHVTSNTLSLRRKNTRFENCESHL